nr:helix-turn-helix transcriptional regulator [Mesorhizobium metallidurans]
MHGHAQVVGRNVQKIRQKKRLTQEQLAEISGFSQQYISGLEKGRRNPTIVTNRQLREGAGSSACGNPFQLARPAPAGIAESRWCGDIIDAGL